MSIDSEAGFWTAMAAAALLVAVIAWLGDWRRHRRAHPDRVGCMPWTMIFFAALFVGGVSVFMALQYWLHPV